MFPEYLLQASLLRNNSGWFLLDVFFTYIASFIPFPHFPSEIPLSHPYSCSLTHPLLLPYPNIPLHWVIEPSQDQETLLSLMSHKAFLCYICGWRHGSLHVYPLAGGLVPESSGGTGAINPFSSLGPFSSSSIGWL